MFPWAQPVAFVNARVLTAEGLAPTLRFGSRILSIGDPPHRGDMVVDLNGAFVLPGLINAHDHLELNHYGLLKRRNRYDNATAWFDDLRPALRNEPSTRAGQTPPLAEESSSQQRQSRISKRTSEPPRYSAVVTASALTMLRGRFVRSNG